MIKKLHLLFLLFPFWILAQTSSLIEPAQWNFSIEKLSSTQYQITFKADIEENWHIYSQFTPEGGPLALDIQFENLNTDFTLVGAASESEVFTQYNETFGVNEVFFKDQLTITQKIELKNPEVKFVKGTIFYQICRDVCINQDIDFVLSLSGEEISSSIVTIDQNSSNKIASLKLPLKNQQLIFENGHTIDTSSHKNKYFNIFLLGFLGGFIALLTPCVFPMIPLTVSFFTKQNKNKRKGVFNALLYGFFIFLIYILLSLPFHFLDSVDPEFLNSISTNVSLNVFFFVVFVVFAFSFFGFYELTLPSSWSNKMDNASNIGGLIGIFFMALTLAIVSFSCTGPILGSLLAGTLSSEGGALQLTAGMAGFGCALALPFALFALFPNLLNGLPKSGSWMTSLKVILGFLELAFAFKFLSNADLVAQWGLLKRETFVGIWLILSLLLGLYLFGLYRFPHEVKHKISKLRIALGLLLLGFSAYLFSGLIGKNNLKLLSGFPPPSFYSYIASKDEKCPLGLTCFKDFEQGLSYAKKVNKPILLDFTGWTCVNCRKMEDLVWSIPSVHRLMKEEFVLISLYIDDATPLPINEQFDFQLDNGRIKTIKTVGSKWATFETVNFKTNSQPYYIILSPDLEVLTPAIQYTSAQTYKNWLESGLARFNKSK